MAPKKRAVGIMDQGPLKSFPRGRTWFLGIGINKYKHWPPLQNAVRDVMAVKDILLEQYGLSPEHVLLLCNEEATRANVIDKLDRLADTILSPDSLIIYYAGHGHLKRTSGFWVPADASTGGTAGYIRNSTIKDFLSEIPSLHTLLISDSCFSGNLLLRGQRSSTMAAEKLAALPSRYAICSGRHGETVSDGPVGGHSPFAQSILQVLQSNDRPYLTAETLKERVFERTATQTDQTPLGAPLRVEGHELGQYVFWRVNDEKNAWQQAQAENTVEAYVNYRAKFPQGQFRTAALEAIEHLEKEEEAWENTQVKGRLSAYLAYLDDYPNGQFAEEAREWIQKRQQAKVTPPTSKPSPKKTPKRIDDNLIWIEGGSFMMGSEEARYEHPIHEVQVPSFFLSPYPVTFAEYDLYCSATGKAKPYDKGWGRDRRPVINVSWKVAVDYCNWLSRQEGLSLAYNEQRNLIVGAGGYRLPSEAEWDYAARGGRKSKGFRYAGSNTLAEVGWYGRDSRQKTQPVGQKMSNELGLYDMSGNVWEWCTDDWHENYEGAPDDGSPWVEGEGDGIRVVRGGSWIFSPDEIRIAGRRGDYEGQQYYDNGFRLARS